MLLPLLCEDYLAHDAPILDVRSPKEFAQGHIPGAHSLPLFTDAERAVVGTLYKQQGRDVAVLEGLRIIGPKLADLVHEARTIATGGVVRVHCWRGGERSASMAWLLDKAGFAEVFTLQGGYRTFRRHVLESFTADRQLCVLGGYTGTGKTATLEYLRDLGEQVIDLEAIAHHKGSSFGAIGEAPQPTTEHFENVLWEALLHIDPTRPCWVEDESMTIGRVKIPDGFFARMRASQLFFAEMTMEERADRLVEDYGRFPPELLAEAIRRIQKRLGPQHCKAALDALAIGDMRTVAIISLRYYDKTYAHGTSQRDPQRITRLPASQADLRGLAQRLKDHAAATRAHR
ncbi:MAG: tRNA 2-selenouridine(34) synthase MnmH [Flavobacteriales bacterium]|nr:tRNA 2-selenouridine(34) synthase MnmH [Flavobacteriales bacterium]